MDIVYRLSLPFGKRLTFFIRPQAFHRYVRPDLDINGTRLTPDLDNLQTRPYPPAIWRKSDIEFALEWEWHQGDGSRSIYETLRTYYAPCYMVLTDDHPLFDFAIKTSEAFRLRLIDKAKSERLSQVFCRLLISAPKIVARFHA
ncbi:hypothetical protein ACFLX4_01415 [Chloroflexota bacterium]